MGGQVALRFDPDVEAAPPGKAVDHEPSVLSGGSLPHGIGDGHRDRGSDDGLPEQVLDVTDDKTAGGGGIDRHVVGEGNGFAL